MNSVEQHLFKVRQGRYLTKTEAVKAFKPQMQGQKQFVKVKCEELFRNMYKGRNEDMLEGCITTAWCSGHEERRNKVVSVLRHMKVLSRRQRNNLYNSVARVSMQTFISNLKYALGQKKESFFLDQKPLLFDVKTSSLGTQKEPTKEPQKELQKFDVGTWSSWDFEGEKIKTALLPDGKPVFLVKSIAECLGLNTRHTAMLVNRIPEAHRGTSLIGTPGGRQRMLAVTEPGLYYIVMRSDSKKAEPLRLFMCEQVLSGGPERLRLEDSLLKTQFAGVPDVHTGSCLFAIPAGMRSTNVLTQAGLFRSAASADPKKSTKARRILPPVVTRRAPERTAQGSVFLTDPSLSTLRPAPRAARKPSADSQATTN